MTTRAFAVSAAVPVALLLAAISAAGILHPALYAREAPSWAEQALGQDWFDLLVAAPWIAVCGWCARTGSRTWRVLLAGAYAYTVYELVIYAFAIHFNALFLVYCATLGLATFALLAMLSTLRRSVPEISRPRSKLAGGFLVALGSAFALLWLVEDVRAMWTGTASETLRETGLLTNPVHVVDLAFVLPAHIITGLWLYQRKRRGELYAPVLLAFGVPMAASIATMMVVMGLRGAPTAFPVLIVMYAIALITAVMLALTLGAPSLWTKREAPAPAH